MSETPFGRATRQNLRQIDTLDFQLGGIVSRAIPRVGYLARIYLTFSGTLNVNLGGGTATLDQLGPWNMLSRLRVAANSGQDIYSLSGWMTYLLNQVANGADWDISDPEVTAARNYSPSIYAAGVASGNNNWRVPFIIPVALNEMSEAGVILLQNELSLTQLLLQCAPAIYNTAPTVAPVVVTGGATATLTGVFTPVVEYFAVPADEKARPDILWLHQCLEFTQPIAAVGDQQVNLLRDNIYLQILHSVILNGALNSTAIERLRLVINQSDTPYDLPLQSYLTLSRHRYHRDLPDGTFIHDLFYQGFPGFGGERDLLNGRATSELQSILTVASGTTLGSNPRIITATRQLVRLAEPPARAA
jgi:hypothetical protein